MNVELADERLLILADRFSMEHAEGRAWTRRVEAFGTLARVTGFLKQPRDEEFEIVYRERRMQPFWRLAVRTIQAYERRRDYQVNVAPEVQSVEIAGAAQTPVGGKITVGGLETCREERAREVFYDGLSKEPRLDLAEYLRHPAKEAAAGELAELSAAGTIVAPSEAKASTLVRDVVAGAIGRIEADRVLEETVRLEAIELYYRPVYAFRFRWQGKEAVVEFDALSGEAKVGGSTFEQYAGKLADPKFLLDIGAEAANMFIPGANLAKLAIVKGIELARR